MADDGKIYITISDKRGVSQAQSENASANLPAETSSQESKKSNAVFRYAEQQFFNMIKTNAVKMINYSVSNIGNFSGDYIRQANIQAGLSFLSSVAGIAGAAISGAKIGGPVGAVIAAGVAVAGIGVSFYQAEYKANFENRRINREISILRDLSGMNTLLDGSRGALN